MALGLRAAALRLAGTALGLGLFETAHGPAELASVWGPGRLGLAETALGLWELSGGAGALTTSLLVCLE